MLNGNARQGNSVPLNSVNSLKLMYTNCDSLPNKIEELKVYVKEFRLHIIALTECIPRSMQKSLHKRDELIVSLQIEVFEVYHNWTSTGIEEMHFMLICLLNQQPFRLLACY